MGSEYDSVPLGEVAAVRSGFAFKSSDWTSSGVPVVKIANVKDGTLVMDGCSFVAQNIAEEAREFALKAGDILIAMTGYIGDVARVRDRDLPAVLNQRVGRFSILDHKRLDQHFLFYLLRDTEVRKKIEGLGYGSAQPNVSPSLIHRVEVPLPPLPEQQAIACILGALDDKIELNRRMNQTLEAMARAIFKSWFVDFDPVRAKDAVRREHPGWTNEQVSRAACPNLKPEIAALFPDSFEDSELGEIPKGWVIGVLDGLSATVLGGDWGVDDPSLEHTERTRCIRGADIPDLQAGGMGRMPVRYLKPSSLEKRRLSHGDLVIEISGGSPTQSTGRPVLVSDRLLQRVNAPLVCSNFCRLLRPKKAVYSKFVYLWLRSMYSADEFLQFENGTTGIKNFAFTLFSSNYKLCIPSDDVLAAFEDQVSPAFTRQQSAATEADTLAALRDTLLPKLISGVLRVPDAERIVGRTL